MNDRIEDTLERVAKSRARSIETLHRAIETERRVIDENKALAEVPGHRDSARQRIVEGQRQLREMEAELAALEREVPEDNAPTV